MTRWILLKSSDQVWPLLLLCRAVDPNPSVTEAVLQDLLQSIEHTAMMREEQELAATIVQQLLHVLATRCNLHLRHTAQSPPDLLFVDLVGLEDLCLESLQRSHSIATGGKEVDDLPALWGELLHHVLFQPPKHHRLPEVCVQLELTQRLRWDHCRKPSLGTLEETLDKCAVVREAWVQLGKERVQFPSSVQYWGSGDEEHPLGSLQYLHGGFGALRKRILHIVTLVQYDNAVGSPACSLPEVLVLRQEGVTHDDPLRLRVDRLCPRIHRLDLSSSQARPLVQLILPDPAE
mmetsp:Transcript_146258/g.380111  ORF Transcript_146258/g.380111 Transcript_146258/m.380111 type:complete len:291 (+) Transcript_146258:2010-2882(+)